VRDLLCDRTLFETLRAQVLVQDELQRMVGLFCDRLLESEGALRSDGAEDPALGAAAGLLRKAEIFLLRHPVAVQAIFSALVAEGRRFAATPEGAAWRDELAASPLLREARRVWEASAFSMLEEDPDVTLPSTYAEVLHQALRAPDVEPLLRRLLRFDQGGPRGSAA
jgi:hypothetical protein